MNFDNGQHTSEEQLILHHYGEEDRAAAAAVDLHLEQCEVCRAEYAGLRGVLAAVNEETVPVPDRGEFYGQETWNRVRGSIGGGVSRFQQQQHIGEEEMTLHYYDEAEGLGAGGGTVTEHLLQCAECRNRFAELRQLLASIDAAAVRVPERSETYGREVWKRVQGRLTEATAPQPETANAAANVVTMPVSLQPRRDHGGNNWRTWAAIAAMLVVGVSGYLAGRWSAADGKKNARVTVAGAVEGADAQFEAGRKRVLMVALTDHFERSQMVLAELSNADAGQAGKLDIRYERDEASELLDSNRLYRQAAQQQGDTQAAVLLEDLERMLLEVAHAPDQVGSGEFQDLQKRIQDQGLVFKVKVLTSRLERQNNKL